MRSSSSSKRGGGGAESSIRARKRQQVLEEFVPGYRKQRLEHEAEAKKGEEEAQKESARNLLLQMSLSASGFMSQEMLSFRQQMSSPPGENGTVSQTAATSNRIR